MIRVLCVLRSGGDYSLEHVWSIRRGLNRHLPLPYRHPGTANEPGTWTFQCLTDVPGLGRHAIPLEHGWPGWWSKLEVCRPDITGPVLFVDLDTVLVEDLAPLVSDLGRSIVLRDFYRRRNSVQSAFMLLTEEDRAVVWDEFQRDPEGQIRRLSSDQVVYERVLRDRAARWQDTHPGLVVGYKTDIHRAGRDDPPPDARVVVFHGQPRPWSSGHEWAQHAPSWP